MQEVLHSQVMTVSIIVHMSEIPFCVFCEFADENWSWKVFWEHIRDSKLNSALTFFLMKKKRKFNQPFYIYIIDYQQDFDCPG